MQRAVIVFSLVVVGCTGGASPTSRGSSSSERSGEGSGETSGEGSGERSAAPNGEGSGEGSGGETRAPGRCRPSPAPSSGSALDCANTNDARCYCDDYSVKTSGRSKTASCGAGYSCCLFGHGNTNSSCTCSNISETECVEWTTKFPGVYTRQASCP